MDSAVLVEARSGPDLIGPKEWLPESRGALIAFIRPLRGLGRLRGEQVILQP